MKTDYWATGYQVLESYFPPMPELKRPDEVALLDSTAKGFRRVQDTFNTIYQIWEGGILETAEQTFFCFLYEGQARLEFGTHSFQISEEMYFIAPSNCLLSGEGKALVCAIKDYDRPFLLGGPIEEKGRLRYIDGCSDSLLISPAMKGDPCFNFLYVPPGINQTAHTHPSVRIGMIIEGNGICRTPEAELELSKGKVFILPPDAIHSFHTEEDILRIVVFHPDSDTGPSHDDHPMLNRSFIGEESAKHHDEIRTKEIE